MTARKRGGTSGRSWSMGGGGSVATLMQTSGNVSARNGGFPARSSYRMTPSAQISDCGVTSLDERICSGDM